jgi:hypothetical protein
MNLPRLPEQCWLLDDVSTTVVVLGPIDLEPCGLEVGTHSGQHSMLGSTGAIDEHSLQLWLPVTPSTVSL